MRVKTSVSYLPFFSTIGCTGFGAGTGAGAALAGFGAAGAGWKKEPKSNPLELFSAFFFSVFSEIVGGLWTDSLILKKR